MNTPILNLPYPTSADTADVPRDIQALAMAIDPLGTIPVGGLLLWPTAVTPSSAWLLCQGQSVDAATYPALALVLGSTAGQIAIPDFRNTFPMGAGSDAAPLAAGGAREVTLTGAQVGPHAHGVFDSGHGHTTTAAGAHDHGGVTGPSTTSLDHTHDMAYMVAGWPFGAPANWPMSLGSGYAVPGSNVQGASFITSTGYILGGPGGLTNHQHTIPQAANHAHNVNSSQTGVIVQNSPAATAHENRPPFRAINFIIRAL
jgi:microcystin-dependent protein